MLIKTLAEFYYELRKFLHFGERAAVDAGLQPQQLQLLLQVADAPEGVAVMIAFAAERPSLRHHSVVELVNRSEREGFPHGASEPQLGSLLASYGKTQPTFCVSDQTGDRMANLAASSFEFRQLENRINASITTRVQPRLLRNSCPISVMVRLSITCMACGNTILSSTWICSA